MSWLYYSEHVSDCSVARLQTKEQAHNTQLQLARKTAAVVEQQTAKAKQKLAEVDAALHQVPDDAQLLELKARVLRSVAINEADLARYAAEVERREHDLSSIQHALRAARVVESRGAHTCCRFATLSINYFVEDC